MKKLLALCLLLGTILMLFGMDAKPVPGTDVLTPPKPPPAIAGITVKSSPEFVVMGEEFTVTLELMAYQPLDTFSLSFSAIDAYGKLDTSTWYTHKYSVLAPEMSYHEGLKETCYRRSYDFTEDFSFWSDSGTETQYYRCQEIVHLKYTGDGLEEKGALCFVIQAKSDGVGIQTEARVYYIIQDGALHMTTETPPIEQKAQKTQNNRGCGK